MYDQPGGKVEMDGGKRSFEEGRVVEDGEMKDG